MSLINSNGKKKLKQGLYNSSSSIPPGNSIPAAGLSAF